MCDVGSNPIKGVLQSWAIKAPGSIGYRVLLLFFEPNLPGQTNQALVYPRRIQPIRAGRAIK